MACPLCHVFLCKLHRIFEHLGDGGVVQTIGRFHFNSGLYACGLLLCSYRQQTIGIHLEGHTYARCARHHGRNATQGKAGEGAAIAHQFALALHHMDRHRGLAVFKGGEFLRHCSGNGRIAWNDFFHQAAIGFQSQRQRRYIKQQPFIIGFVACQHICLYRRAQSHHFVWIQIVQRGLTKKSGHCLLYMRHACGATHHDDTANIGFADIGIAHRLLHWVYGFHHQVLRQLLEMLAGDVGFHFATI